MREAVSKAVIANREERSGKQSQKINNLSIKRLLRSFLPRNDVLPAFETASNHFNPRYLCSCFCIKRLKQSLSLQLWL